MDNIDCTRQEKRSVVTCRTKEKLHRYNEIYSGQIAKTSQPVLSGFVSYIWGLR